jgi:hypothetical protein
MLNTHVLLQVYVSSVHLWVGPVEEGDGYWLGRAGHGLGHELGVCEWSIGCSHRYSGRLQNTLLPRTGRFTVVRSTQGRLLGANLRVIQRVLGEDGQNAAAERRKKKKKKKKEDVGSGLVYVIVLDCPWIVDFAIQAGWNLRTASYGVLS